MGRAVWVDVTKSDPLVDGPVGLSCVTFSQAASAASTYPGMERPLALSLPGSLRHLHIIGPTGVGKSTLLLGLICQDQVSSSTCAGRCRP